HTWTWSSVRFLTPLWRWSYVISAQTLGTVCGIRLLRLLLCLHCLQLGSRRQVTRAHWRGQERRVLRGRRRLRRRRRRRLVLQRRLHHDRDGRQRWRHGRQRLPGGQRVLGRHLRADLPGRLHRLQRHLHRPPDQQHLLRSLRQLQRRQRRHHVFGGQHLL